MKPVVFFRCDADQKIGGGHVMRCLVLADALRELGASSVFLVSEATQAAVPSLQASGHPVGVLDGADDATARSAMLHAAENPDVLVYDLYGTDPGRLIEAMSARMLVTFADGDYWTTRPAGRDHVVIAADRISPARHCDHWLSGPRYALVRRTLLGRRGEAEARDRGTPPERILVFFGMADGADGCGATLDAFRTIDLDVGIDVVVGPAARHLGALRERASQDPRVLLAVSPADFDELVVCADLAIGAGGVAAFERAMLGLPTIAFEVSANQRDGLTLLAQAGALLHGGHIADLPARLPGDLRGLAGDPDLRRALSSAGLAAVDGLGAQRVAAVLSEAVA